MKLTNILKLTAISLTALLASCGEHKDDHAGHDHASDENHEGHDHASKKKDEHAGHDHEEGEDEHANCGVVVGANGGRMIKEVAELNLTDAGALTLTFLAAPAEGTKVVLLQDGTPLELTQAGSAYTSATVADNLPAEIHVSIKQAGEDKIVEKITVEAGKCEKCNNKKLACTCHNHDNSDHDDHEEHDHAEGEHDDH